MQLGGGGRRSLLLRLSTRSRVAGRCFSLEVGPGSGLNLHKESIVATLLFCV
jgi:hypothetical protein